MQDDIERILADEEGISPSPNFLASVMAAVEREATAPKPLAFPWIRALPGFLAAFAALAVAVWNGIGSLNDPASLTAFGEQLRQFSVLATGVGLYWILLAVAITLVSLLVPLGLTRARI
jgi:hypothetical protein